MKWRTDGPTVFACGWTPRIVDGMVNQYAKFLKAGEVPWREPVASRNYILTSDGWRQEHNGYSHHEYQRRLAMHREYIVEHGVDPPEIADWSWSA